MLTKDGIDDVKSAKDIPKKANGKREELSRELYAGLFVNFEGYLFGKVDCEMLELLGIESSNTSRDFYCSFGYNSYSECWATYAYVEGLGGHYTTDCTFSYTYYGYCFEYETIGASEEDNPGEDDDVVSGNSFRDPNEDDNIVPKIDDKDFDCLYNKFMEGNSSLFNQTIGSFKDLTDYHLNFKSCEDDNRAGCQTYTSSWYNSANGKNVDIFLDLSISNLEMAESILHEGIHAAIKLYLANKDVPNGLSNTVEILQYYKHYSGYADWADHIFIGDFYIKPLARALKQLDGHRYPEYKYYGLVYEGIERSVEEAGVQRLVENYSRYKTYNSEVIRNSRLCD